MYDQESQFTINWKDPKYKFKWPCKKPILSQRSVMKRKILIFGGSGFVGMNLAKFLLKKL